MSTASGPPKLKNPRSAQWRRMSFGLALSAAAGMIIGHAWTSEDGSWWWLGATTLLSATLMVFSGIYAGGGAEPKRPRLQLPSLQAQRVEERWEIEPMLGEILVENGTITTAELLMALERQAGTGLLLGEVLVDMRLISLEQLEHALDEQTEWQDSHSARHTDSRVFRIMARAGEAETAS